ncbi:MAG TPA: FHA domain-containing protein [Fimbriimonadales bacterium]|nr:FHA domain-containing protein [Fimbriimonadales bacterium]
MKKGLGLYFAMWLSLLGVLGNAAEIKIVFSSEKNREISVLSEIPNEIPRGREFTAKEVDFPLEDKKGYLAVYETDSGNVAIKPIEDIEGGIWKVSEKDWRIGQVRISAYQGGGILNYGMVVLRVGNEEKKDLLANGKVDFYFVPPGEAEVKIRYLDGTERKTISQKMVLSLKRDNRVPDLAVKVPGEPKAPIAQKTEGVPSESSGGSALGNFFGWILSLGIAAIALYTLLRLLKRHESLVLSKLRSLGVEVPTGEPSENINGSPQTEQKPFEQATIVPEGHCPYCGEPYREDGTCACTIQTVPTSAVASLQTYKLVGEGIQLEIPEGTHVIGREGELCVTDSTVSRRHAEIRRENSRVFIKDIGSSNGTFVNGKKIEEETELRSGDTVQLGSVRLAFES